MGEAAALALIDANQFYVACERVFDPKLQGMPVVVLSNNDGCIIARSEEVQALGIGMGEPVFKARPLIARHGIRTFSSNYALYGDMSRRVNDVLNRFTPKVEIYSIDESFLGLAGLGIGDPWAWGQDLRATVRRWTGIPTCLGLGPSKTLAKLANRIAKKNPVFAGVCDLFEPVLRAAVLRACPAAMGVARPWRQHMAHRSPRYTTRLDELPVVRAWAEDDALSGAWCWHAVCSMAVGFIAPATSAAARLGAGGGRNLEAGQPFLSSNRFPSSPAGVPAHALGRPTSRHRHWRLVRHRL